MIPTRTLLGILTLFIAASSSLKAQACTPLSIVQGEGTEVKKTVSTPNLLVFGNNWNTDFTVPSYPFFQRYIATIQSNSSKVAKFEVEMFLKYSDGSVDRAFEGNIEIISGQAREIKASPRFDQQPYQINLNIGGLGSLGFTYTLSVQGCS
jgi:hypothetical protein